MSRYQCRYQYGDAIGNEKCRESCKEGTVKEHIRQLLAQARRGVEESYAAAEAAWGPTELGKALPQAIQLADRIKVGEALLHDRPGDPAVKRALNTLRAMLRRAQADPADQKRCAAFQEAHERFLAADALYLGRIQEAREIYGLSDEEIAEAQRQPERVAA